VQRSATIFAFVLLFGALTAVLLFEGSREIDRPSAAEAFFEKYQERAPSSYSTGRIVVENVGPGSKMTIDMTFDTRQGLMYATTDLNGERVDTRTLSVPPQFAGAEIKPRGVEGGFSDSFEQEPYSVQFRADPRAKTLGARQLVVEFAAREPHLTSLTQLLMIDAATYELIFAESSWGSWDAREQRWNVQQSRVLSNLNEPVEIEAMPR
jgi:hypothetical protein